MRDTALIDAASAEIEPPLHLPVGLLGKADPPGLATPAGAGDIDAVAHGV